MYGKKRKKIQETNYVFDMNYRGSKGSLDRAVRLHSVVMINEFVWEGGWLEGHSRKVE